VALQPAAARAEVCAQVGVANLCAGTRNVLPHRMNPFDLL
jgi:hypothetical protein